MRQVEAIRVGIEGLSPKAEFVIVILGAFGYFIVTSVLVAIFPAPTPPITQHHLVFLLAYESVTLTLLGSVLYLRGWTPTRMGISITPRDTLIGLGLAVVVYVAYVLVWWLAIDVGLRPVYSGGYRELAVHDLKLPAVIAVSVLNPIYEETFLCGFIVTAAKKYKRSTAGINVSVAIRVLYHLYQGSVGVLGIIPVGLIFALWYARSGRLWPVFVAHALFDAIGLLQFLG